MFEDLFFGSAGPTVTLQPEEGRRMNVEFERRRRSTMNQMRTVESSNDTGIMKSNEGERSSGFRDVNIFDRPVFGEILSKIIGCDVVR